MPRVQGLDADQRRRTHRGIFSLSTPFQSAAASSRNRGHIDDMDDMEFRICPTEESHILPKIPPADSGPQSMDFDHARSHKEGAGDIDKNVADVSERRRIGGTASAPFNLEQPYPPTEQMALVPDHSRTNVKPHATSLSAIGKPPSHCHDTGREKCNLPAEKKNTKRASSSPFSTTKNTATALRTIVDPSVSASTPQLKSPPELFSKTEIAPTSAAGFAHKSRSSPESRCALPATVMNRAPQSYLADPNSWIDALRKRTSSAPRRKMEGPAEKTNSPKRIESNVCAPAKGGIVISNLEESYFKKPAPNPGTNANAPVPNKSVALQSPQPNHLAPDGVDETSVLSSAPSALAEDERSETTLHRSNESTQRKSKPSSTNHRAGYDDDCSRTRTETISPRKGSEEGNSARNDDGSSVDADADMERAKVESKKLAEQRRNAKAKWEVKYEADLARALAESRNTGRRSAAPEVIDLVDSDDEEDSKMPAKTQSASRMDEDVQMEEAMKLSLEEAKKAKQHDEHSERIPQFGKLTRDEFEEVVNGVVAAQGGYEKIESGQLVKHGNANDMKTSRVADGGGRNQTGAQYGRYSIHRMWRLFDVLQGQADVNIEESDTNESKRKRDENRRLHDLPGAKIKAFVDIGHGIGLQVLQAGWALGVPSRGVEIMKDRHLIAQAIEEEVLASLRRDPPDATMVQLKCADFSCAVIPYKKTNKRDEILREFLLFRDKSEEVQRGLVFFINNAEEVFAARSNQRTGGACLDTYLANLFANMEIGGRMVTLTDVSCHLSQSSEWFRLDIFQSGSNAVPWGSSAKSVSVYVLTKLTNDWFCQNQNCDYRKYEGGKDAPNLVVDENGELCERCIYCHAPAKRSTRTRKPSAKRRKEES